MEVKTEKYITMWIQSRNRLMLSVFSLSLIFAACKSAKTTVQKIDTPQETVMLQPGEKVQLQRFVSVEAVADLRTGMTIEQVYAILGSNPFNFISAQSNGYHVVQYKYRLSNIEVPISDINTAGIERKINKLQYQQDLQDLYIVFNGLGKMEYLVTSQGNISEKLLRDNNLIYVIKKDKEKFETNKGVNYMSTNSVPFMPMMPCTDCELIRAGMVSTSQYVPQSSVIASSMRSDNTPVNNPNSGENSICSVVTQLMIQVSAGQSMIDDMSEADKNKNTKDKLKQLIEAEKAYAGQIKIIDKTIKELQGIAGVDNCTDYKAAFEKKKKMEADYLKRSSSNSKGVGSKIISKTLSGL